MRVVAGSARIVDQYVVQRLVRILINAWEPRTRTPPMSCSTSSRRMSNGWQQSEQPVQTLGRRPAVPGWRYQRGILPCVQLMHLRPGFRVARTTSKSRTAIWPTGSRSDPAHEGVGDWPKVHHMDRRQERWGCRPTGDALGPTWLRKARRQPGYGVHVLDRPAAVRRPRDGGTYPRSPQTPTA